MSGRRGALLVALLVVAAGGVAVVAGPPFPSGSEPTAAAAGPDGSPASTGDATATATATPARSFPPGTGPDGIEDPTALVTAHRRALLDDRFRLVAERTRRSTGTAGTATGTTRRRVRAAVAPDDGRYRVRSTWSSASERGRADEWAGPDADRAIKRSRWRPVDPATTASGSASLATSGDLEGTAPTYSTTPAAAPAALTYTRWIESLLARGSFALAALEEADGTRGRRYVYTADEYVPADGERVEADRLGYDATLVVDARGRILSFRATVVRVETTTLGATRRVSGVSYRLVAAGGPDAGPRRPAWVGTDRDGDGTGAGDAGALGAGSRGGVDRRVAVATAAAATGGADRQAGTRREAGEERIGAEIGASGR
jgi:hypothetical protein